MEGDELKPAVVIALGILTIGFVLTALSAVSMRMAYHRAQVEIAASCARASVVIIGRSKYFCAPVAQVERVDPDAATIPGAGFSL
jgi:hypothetical protein